MSKILVVDDWEDVARSVAMVLEGAGYTCRIATSGEEALATAGTWQPDLILLDLRMRGLCGIRVMEVLKNERHLDVPVILMSGYLDDIGPTERQLAFGAVEKPVEVEKLLREVGRATAGANQ